MAKQGEHPVRGTTCIREISRTHGCSYTLSRYRGTPVAAYFRSARSSETTWAARHGRLHLPRPLLASADHLLLLIIAVFVWWEYTISEKKCQGGSFQVFFPFRANGFSAKKQGAALPPPAVCTYRLLERIQMPCFSALAMRSSRNMGWAMLTNFSARSQVEQPTRFTPPYSVTM